jgi:hypothetical protein
MNMYRVALALVAIALSLVPAEPADAQSIGVKLGASMSKLSVDGSMEGADWSTGFVGGGFVRLGMGRLGIQAEVLAVTKGVEYESQEAGVGDQTIAIEYVAIPLLLHLPLTWGASIAPYLIAGPEFAFDIGCETSYLGTVVDCESEDFPDGPLERRNMDIGFSAGGGFAFAVGPGAILLEARYTWGLTNIADTQDAGEIRNRSAYLTAGYSIPVGRR